MKLCGVRISNYYNKVRLALLEKGVEFEEDDQCPPSQDEGYLERSAMGKVPYLEVDGKTLTESQAICEYLEETYPQRPLYPKDPWERAKVRELINYLELHVELVSRRLHKQVFYGGTVSDESKAQVERELTKGLKALAKLAKFSPAIAGPELTLADVCAFVHLSIVSVVTRVALGRDMVDEFLPQAKPYLKMLGERPAFQRVSADRKAAAEAVAARRKKS
ncbi:MAG: glutathione S-transferase family protein [Betaproteobacteria bacterium]|jgi:glutathione S-transferase|nr:glutathione S-transferase family protein [Betaproteobacteria bacterium]